MSTLDLFTEATTLEDTDLLHLKRGTGANSDKKATGATIKSYFATAAQGAKVDFLTVTQPVDLDAIEARVNQLDAAVVLVGEWDASVGTFPGGGTAQAGQSWIVSVAGTVDGVDFGANDRIIAITDNASTATYAANWHKADYTDEVLSVAGLIGAISAGDLRTAINVENGATADQTDGEIKTAYNNQVAAASQAEMEAGTEAAIRRMTPERVAQAIAVQAFKGTKYIGVNNQTGTAYGLVLADAGKLITMNNAAANTLTIPANASVAFEIGTRIDVLQKGAGQTTVAITTDTLNGAGGLKINTQWETVSLLKIAATEWVMVGGVA